MNASASMPTYPLTAASEWALSGQPLPSHRGQVYLPFHTMSLQFDRYGHMRLVFSCFDHQARVVPLSHSTQYTVQQLINDIAMGGELRLDVALRGAVGVELA